MKLFLQEHIPLICYTIGQLFIVLFIYWFDGYPHILTALYSVFMGIFLLTGYLIYRYYSHRSFYKRLSTPMETLNESIQDSDLTPLSMALDKLLQTQYQNYQNQLKKWDRKQQEQMTFMNQWVHQMKTPLSVIELITQDADDPRFDSIIEETERIKKGLEMVLYVARLETFEQDFHVDRVQLLEMIDSVIHENKRLFIRSYVYPEVRVDPLLTVETDKKWFQFILNQVITNAIKYSSSKKEKIIISAYSKGRAVILDVRDHGVGIPAADLPRVFHPFYTGENGRKFKESTGMGLYLVKEVCGKLNHRIEIQSEADKGTKVSIVFPYASR
ncbi:sensor histidine kinase [Brevibacillus brevis]|uniref:histidine kinase n=1 Tax=Brevibacillus brevis TaxID=1393 RepID=A0A517I4V2_BREBE|nr:sensor histidine kinase [Brevibacillus brevis]QDS33928.1 HAMP domain-containing histidine kinase [Brevibacillus brevis]